MIESVVISPVRSPLAFASSSPVVLIALFAPMLIPPLAFDPGKTVAVIVGPPVMYGPVIAELKKKGLASGRIVVSLERQMRCGVGKCGHCTIEHLYCCQDGPVFRLDLIEHLRGAL